ncbi:DUF2637 domain-containing protein [Streptomyces sp. CA-111067]|uniref:DUF2637 domain-containing protein n=1 Tax=Streptomyces sp. CA-111067 TaxID=3240046 RepID=UPI003D99A0A5
MTTPPPRRRLGGLVRAAWFLVLLMMLAAAAWSISGQLTGWGMATWLAYALSLMFDLAGLICAEYARRAVERGTPAGLPRAAILAFVSVSAILNWTHGRQLGGLPAAYGLAAISGAVELLFELHRRDVRDEQRRERGLVAERMPHIPVLAWVMFPDRAWRTLRGAVGARLDQLDPVQQPPAASGDARDAVPAHHDAEPDTPQVPAMPRISAQTTKTAAILAASAVLQPDASPAAIALLLAQQGVAVDTAYIRTVLSRSKPKDGNVGQGGGGYA